MKRLFQVIIPLLILFGCVDIKKNIDGSTDYKYLLRKWRLDEEKTRHNSS